MYFHCKMEKRNLTSLNTKQPANITFFLCGSLPPILSVPSVLTPRPYPLRLCYCCHHSQGTSTYQASLCHKQQTYTTLSFCCKGLQKDFVSFLCPKNIFRNLQESFFSSLVLNILFGSLCCFLFTLILFTEMTRALEVYFIIITINIRNTTSI